MEDFRGVLIGTTIVLILCSSLSVSLRLCRSFYMLRKFSWHDFFIVMALLSALIMSIGMALLTTGGLGLHESDGSLSLNAPFQQSLVAINVFYLLCNMFVKIGLLLMYSQFTVEAYFHWFIFIMHIATVIFGVSSIFAVIFQCVPLSRTWDYTIPGTCVNVSALYYSNAGIMIGMDMILYIMPILFTWGIQLRPAQKLGLRFLFGLGFLVVIASCIRLWIVDDVLKHGDMSYNAARMLLASAVENHLAICIACAPAIRAMLSSLLIPKMQDYYVSSRERLSRLPSFPSSRQQSQTSSSSIPQDSRSPLKKHNRNSTITSRFYAGILGPLSWSLRSRTQTQTQTRDPDPESLDFDFHDSIPNPLPTVHTLVAQGPDPRRPFTSEKETDKIYVKREISTRECFLPDSSPIFGRNPDFNWIDSETDAQSTVSPSINGGTTNEDVILTVPSLAFFETMKADRKCECKCHPGRVVSPAHLCGWCSPACY